MKRVLSIAGSDSGGGAGIQADIKTIAAHGAFGMTVITALTAQNTVGVQAVAEIEPSFVAAQMDSVFSDLRPDAVKIGMLSRAEIIHAVAERLTHYSAANIVLDPVMVATSGGRLLDPEAVDALKAELFPLAALVTPNMPEAAALCGFEVTDYPSMLHAAESLSEEYSVAVLLKGGHLDGGSADDLLISGGRRRWIRAERVETRNTHGTGCTLSAAIACNLAAGLGLEESVERAKAYVTGALSAGLNIGSGNGPLDHGWQTRKGG